jgi:hypothetical protein
MYFSVRTLGSTQFVVLVSMLQPRCQKEDWPRHKDLCAPIEEIVENDDLWNQLGFRKGITFC